LKAKNTVRDSASKITPTPRRINVARPSASRSNARLTKTARTLSGAASASLSKRRLRKRRSSALRSRATSTSSRLSSPMLIGNAAI